MLISDFDFDLPEALIAKYPTSNRAASRLLHVDRTSGAISDAKFTDLLDLINQNDCLIMNDSRVIKAQLYGQKSTGGQVGCLIERIVDDQKLTAHIKASKAPKVGQSIQFEGGLVLTVTTHHESGLFDCQYVLEGCLYDYLDQYGGVPLPPYFKREPEPEDVARYQTVYANEQGSVAAPTAGLHIDEAFLAALKKKGAEVGCVTLHVGAGTFQPVRQDDISQHTMHSERISLDQKTVDLIEQTKSRGGRVFAVGTTTIRVLESVAAQCGQLQAFQGETDIFITPGFTFKVVDALLTNFHLPKSTLIMLVSAFSSLDLIQKAYQQAIENRYRFFSYGDAMIVT